MADNKPDLKSLKQRRATAQQNFTTRINRLNVYAGHLGEVDLSEELARLRGVYDKLLDASNEYIDALGQMDPTGDSDESLDAQAKRDGSERRFLETENPVMEMLWSKYAAPDIDALVTQFKSFFDRAEALGRGEVVPWAQQMAENGTLDRELHELRDAVYTWRDYRPHGKDKWMLFLSLKEDKEQLMDEWTCRRRNEHSDGGSEIVPPDCLRPRSFTTVRSSSLRREADDSRLSISLCDLNLQQEDRGNAHNHAHRHTLHLASASSSSTCPIPQNSLNTHQSSLLPSALESDLHFHQLRGAHIKTLNEQTVARSEHARDERTLVFTNRPLRTGETVFINVTKSSPARAGSLSYGVTSCDPAVLHPSDLPYNPEALVDRKEFWAVCRVPTPLQSNDILGFLVNQEGEVILSHNGTNVGMQVCVDNSRPLWMFFGLHGAVSQLRILGSTHAGDPQATSNPSSPSSSPHTPSALGSGSSDPVLNGGLCSAAYCSSAGGTTPSSPISLPKSPTFPSGRGPWSDECSICYENTVDTVIYACGHMCLCYTCGLKLKKMSNACCPICRRQIKDIIKTYRST
ncbi:E3 ubiquitin-protein ligase NEURL1 isoform X4 [Solea solea]|uniref:E3 ubiquitin-protein ligase NEURL1 isoform X4 n=1 Tax=Solea solea TaxID=90069 RepID=UPI00272AD1AB|nr:E3 ubiquitin-protein ligase NEURL1 isoform X4 [Solea solea]